MENQSIHSGKIYKAVRGGVKIFDARTMQSRFIANTWYTEDKLQEVLQITFAPKPAKELCNWVVVKKGASIGKTFDLSQAIEDAFAKHSYINQFKEAVKGFIKLREGPHYPITVEEMKSIKLSGSITPIAGRIQRPVRKGDFWVFGD